MHFIKLVLTAKFLKSQDFKIIFKQNEKLSYFYLLDMIKKPSLPWRTL